jgi:replicative DNA helicase
MNAISEAEAFGVAVLRKPPHSIEAESSVLGSLMLDNAALERVGDLLAEGDFYRHEHRLIYAAILHLILTRKEADPFTVLAQLESIGKADEAGGLAYLSALAQYVSGPGNVRRYAEIVRERSVLRKLAGAADEIASNAYNPQGRSVQQLLDAAEESILGIGLSERSSSGADWVSAAEGMAAHSAVLERRHSGEVTAWPTGLPDLDDYLEGGLRPGDLVIVGARPSMGKTALALTIGVHMAAERPVAVLSMEMSQSEVQDRLTAMLGNVSMSEVKRPAHGDGLRWDRVVDGIDRAKLLNLHINDQGGLTINQVRTKARNAKRMFGLSVLVVDYIGLMNGTDPKANRNAQLGEISRGLKNLAKELQIAVLCLAQLNRKAEERADHMPQMSDLRDSGEIEQDADVILFIKRPIMAEPDLGEDWRYYAKVSVAKNRQGRCGFLSLSYLGEQTRFSGWSGPAPTKEAAKKGGRGMS